MFEFRAASPTSHARLSRVASERKPCSCFPRTRPAPRRPQLKKSWLLPVSGVLENSLSATLRAVGALWLHLSARQRGDGWLSSDDKIEVGGGPRGRGSSPREAMVGEEEPNSCQ